MWEIYSTFSLKTHEGRQWLLHIILVFPLLTSKKQMPADTAWKVTTKYGVFSGPYFPVFGLNTKRYSVSLRIQSECGKIRTRKNSVFRHFTQCEYLICSLLMVFYFLYKLIVLAFSMFAQVISFVQITRALTHYNSVLLTYIPWKHQKTFRFFDVFRGNR